MPISVADCGAAEGAGAVPVAVVQPEAEAALAEALAALDEPGSKKPQHKPRKTQDGRAAHAASSITSQASQQHPKSTGPAPSATSPSPKTPVAVAGGPPADPPGATAHSAPAAGAAWLYAQILALMSYMHVLCNEAAFAPHCLLLHVEVRNPSFHLSLVILRSCQLRLAELYIDMHQATPCMGYL